MRHAAITPIGEDHPITIEDDVGIMNLFMADGFWKSVASELDTEVFNFGL